MQLMSRIRAVRQSTPTSRAEPKSGSGSWKRTSTTEYVGYALLVPLFFHPLSHVLSAFVAVHLLIGFTLSIVFQLAHAVESNTFPTPDTHSGTINKEWAVHEVESTVNFAPRNTLLTWYIGGLNFQIEHHLFARICHIHYPAISAIVRETCHEFSLPYLCYPTLRSAIAAHYRFLKTMGRRPADVRGPL
jgi:linoleoyl-CoA desaturase